MNKAPLIKSTDLRFSYELGAQSVLDVSEFSIAGGKVSCFIGKSGVGKTTFLKVLAGILENIDNQKLNLENIYPMGYVSQDPTLLPWSTVIDNILLPLVLKSDKTREDGLVKVDYYLRIFDLYGYKNFYPAQLSGGMKQRVSIIRTLVAHPKLVLMDEPFASLDFELKKTVMLEIDKFVKKTGAIVIFVTHDLDDATRFSDEINILSGKPANITSTIQFKTSRESRLFELPASESEVSEARAKIRNHTNQGQI